MRLAAARERRSRNESLLRQAALKTTREREPEK
jgi:hypothetical protein